MDVGLERRLERNIGGCGVSASFLISARGFSSQV